jgi:hypothetical protein
MVHISSYLVTIYETIITIVDYNHIGLVVTKTYQNYSENGVSTSTKQQKIAGWWYTYPSEKYDCSQLG